MKIMIRQIPDHQDRVAAAVGFSRRYYRGGDAKPVRINNTIMSNQHHNQGQTDASNHKFEPPHETIKELLFTWRDDELKEHAQDNKDYRAGYEHGKKQRGD